MHMKIGVLIYTHNRIEDAKKNMEIVKNWRLGCEDNIIIIHSYNGDFDWYPKKHTEDLLIRRKNIDHQAGASDLIDAGIKAFKNKFPEIEYVIILAADTWIINEQYLRKVLSKMKKEKLYLASCPWGSSFDNSPWSMGLATDFFIVDLMWANKYKLFPLNLANFRKKNGKVIDFIKRTLNLERLLAIKFLRCISVAHNIYDVYQRNEVATSKLFIMKQRMPIHTTIRGKYTRKMYWPKIGLFTQHDLRKKLLLLKKNKTFKI